MKFLLAALAFLLLAPAAHAAPACYPDDDGPNTLGSVDADDIADQVVGLPGANTVLVALTGSHATVALHGAAGSRFGSAVAVGDVNADGCADVAVGAPGANTVSIYPGRPTGVSTTPVVIAGTPGDDFGAAVVIAEHLDYAGADLYVGAPGRSGGAGAVDYFQTDTTGAATKEATFTAVHPVAGERYGSVLGPDYKGVYVGVPTRDDKRGAVEEIRLGGARTITTLRAAKPGDELGASLATVFRPVAGAPGRRGKRGAVLDLNSNKEYTQSTKGVPGKAKPGHRFGAGVTSGRALTCQEDNPFAATVPGGKAVVVVSRQKGCSKLLQPGHGLPGRKGAVVGSSIGLLRFRDDFDEDIYDTLLIGAPATGRVFAHHESRTTVSSPAQTGKQVFAVPESGSAIDAFYP